MGQKAPLKLKEIWAIRVRLQLTGDIRKPALFALAIDSKIHAYDLVSLHVRDIAHAPSRSAGLRNPTQDPTPCAVRDHLADP